MKRILPFLMMLCSVASAQVALNSGVHVGGIAGVASINSNTGVFTFTGPGVSCTGTTCTFSGTSGSYLPLAGGTLTGGLVTAASTTSGPSINIPSGVSPTTPHPGDLSNIGGFLNFTNPGGFNFGIVQETTPLVTNLPVIANSGSLVQTSQLYIDGSNEPGSDFCAKWLAAINQAIAVNAGGRTTIDMRNFYTLQSCGTDAFSTLPTNGDFPLTTLMPAVAITATVPLSAIKVNDFVIRGQGQLGFSLWQAGTGYTGSGATVTATLTGTAISSCTVTAGGSGYQNSPYRAPVPNVSTATGQGGLLALTVTSGSVSGCSVVQGGNYSSTPTVVVGGVPLFEFGNCATYPGNFGSRIENWRISSNGNNPGTQVRMCAMEEGSGLYKTNLIGNNDATNTGDLVTSTLAANQIFEDDEFNSTGANHALSFYCDVNFCYESNLISRMTFNDTAYSVKGLSALYFDNTPFGGNSSVIRDHSEGFASALEVGKYGMITAAGVDGTGTTTVDEIIVDSGGAITATGITDYSGSTCLVLDKSYATNRCLTRSNYPFGGQSGTVSYSNMSTAIGGLNSYVPTLSSSHTASASEYLEPLSGTSTLTLPHALFGDVWFAQNVGSGTITVVCDSGNINGVSSVTLSANQGAPAWVDGTNCWVGLPGGGTTTIASGTATLGTSSISSGGCATVVTVAGSGIATTDTLTVGFNGDPTAVTGYGPSSSGLVLTVYPYPTSGNANFKVCNSTGSSITPGALTLNWRVVR